MRYDTYVKIDIDALEYNINKLKNLVKPAKIQAVLKADAYGHIAKEIFRYLVDFGVENFAVANIIEALELRKLNDNVEIMVFGRISKENIPIAIENNITLTIFSKESAEDLRTILKTMPKLEAKAHIKLNTGFNRLGFDNTREDINQILELRNIENLKIEGVFSHLALANEEEDKLQIKRYNQMVDNLENGGLNLGVKHIADSIAAVDYPWARLDMVRLGAAIYGLRTPRSSYDELGLKGTLSMSATINQIRNINKGDGISYDYLYKAEKPMKIGTVSVGYADGLPRSLSRGGSLFVKGKEAKVIGLMCMDQCMIDLSHIEDVKVGDEVLLFEIDENSIANIGKMSSAALTNKNEILAGIGKRVPRIYTYKGETHVINQLLED